jgi:hypothetical protein
MAKTAIAKIPIYVRVTQVEYDALISLAKDATIPGLVLRLLQDYIALKEPINGYTEEGL